MHRRSVLAGVGLGLLGGFAASGAASELARGGMWSESATDPAGPEDTPGPPEGVANELKRLTNDRRRSVYGPRGTLSHRESLSQCAEYHARQMAEAGEVTHVIDGQTLGARYNKFGLGGQLGDEAADRIADNQESICRVSLGEPNAAQRALVEWAPMGTSDAALVLRLWSEHGVGVAASGGHLYCVQNYL